MCVLAHEGTHDATHLRKSSFYKKLMKNIKLQEPRMLIEERDLKPYIVGVSMYVLFTTTTSKTHTHTQSSEIK